MFTNECSASSLSEADSCLAELGPVRKSPLNNDYEKQETQQVINIV